MYSPPVLTKRAHRTFKYDSEQVSFVRNNIEKRLNQTRCSYIMITSPKESIHQCMLTTSLGISFAEQGLKVLLVDANLRKPSLHTYFNAENRSGFSNVILQNDHVMEHANCCSVNGLFVLTAGDFTSNPLDVWVSSKVASSIAEWRREFDLVLFNAPGFLEFSDAQVLVEHCDGVLLVVQSNKTTLKDAKATKLQVERAHTEIIGVILQTG
ncbi:CpsD/CapB family tyrosine-protein kinase [Fictibacillus nanhaiensis]|uniref:CpsD/CapB family tyrosine-protein kinase n=1 Tax=Fictibacillus nanhaiensis TaxID=742169 RepID=UPI001C9726D8|nr:CpsD/CapB family tyrosine-protein kinase [Fictibacillus nanhaiensis]